MKRDPKQTDAIIALAKAYEEGNTSIISRVEPVLLPQNVKLPDALEEILNTIGSSPIEEPELYAAINTMKPMEYAKLSLKGANRDDFDALDIGLFVNRVFLKITSYVDEEGRYKSTPALDKMKLPTTSSIVKIQEAAEDKDGFEPSVSDALGLDFAVLTDWEKGLAMEMASAFIAAVNGALLGNVVDRTPFGRYLKN